MARAFRYLLIFLQTVLLVGAAGALALCVLVFGIPGFGDSTLQLEPKRRNLERQVAGLRSENRYLEAFQPQEAEYVARIGQLREQIETLRTILPEEPATEQFTRIVSEVGTRSGVRIRNVAALPQKPYDF